jgi:hypothetical protein
MTRLVPWICAALFALFHLLTVVATLFATGGSGEGQGMLVVVLDLPLVLLVQVLPGGHLLTGSRGAYILFFSIAGTGMYAFAGYGFGILLRSLGRIARQALDRMTLADAREARARALKMAPRFVLYDLLALVAIAGLSALSLPMQPLQSAWTGLHAPAVALANAALPQSAGDALSVIAVALIALVYVAAIGAAVGWLTVAVRCSRAK